MMDRYASICPHSLPSLFGPESLVIAKAIMAVVVTAATMACCSPLIAIVTAIAIVTVQPSTLNPQAVPLSLRGT